MPISLTIDNFSSETVNLTEFSTPRKTPCDQSNHEKADGISSFNFKDAKIQSSSPICIKHNTPKQNKFASDDSIELGLQSTMNNEDNSSIFNSKTDENESYDNVMYLIPKEPQFFAELQVKVLIKREFKEKLRNLERKLLTKNEGSTITPKLDYKKVYDGILKSLPYITAIEREISR